MIENLDVDVRINRAQEFDFAILARDQGLFHGGELDVEIGFGQIEIGREGFDDVTVFIPLEGETARLIFPADAVEIEKIGEQLFAGMAEGGVLDGGMAGGDDAVFGKLETGLKLDLGFGGGGEKRLLRWRGCG